jgi:hypothetical protein
MTKPERYSNYDDIMKDLLHGENHMKLGAMTYIHEFADHEAVISALIELLDNESNIIREHAIDALGNCGEKAMVVFDRFMEIALQDGIRGVDYNGDYVFDTPAAAALAKIAPKHKGVHQLIKEKMNDRWDLFLVAGSLQEIDEELLGMIIKEMHINLGALSYEKSDQSFELKKEHTLKEYVACLVNNPLGVQSEVEELKKLWDSKPRQYKEMKRIVEGIMDKMSISIDAATEL